MLKLCVSPRVEFRVVALLRVYLVKQVIGEAAFWCLVTRVVNTRFTGNGRDSIYDILIVFHQM